MTAVGKPGKARCWEKARCALKTALELIKKESKSLKSLCLSALLLPR